MLRVAAATGAACIVITAVGLQTFILPVIVRPAVVVAIVGTRMAG